MVDLYVELIQTQTHAADLVQKVTLLHLYPEEAIHGLDLHHDGTAVSLNSLVEVSHGGGHSLVHSQILTHPDKKVNT